LFVHSVVGAKVKTNLEERCQNVSMSAFTITPGKQQRSSAANNGTGLLTNSRSIPPPLLPFSPSSPRGLDAHQRYELLSRSNDEPPRRDIVDKIAALTLQKRHEQVERWEERVRVTETLKKTPRPPMLVNKSVFSDDVYGELVKEKRLELAQQARKKAALMASRNDDDEGFHGGGGGGGLGLDGVQANGELRGEDLRNFQKQWFVMTSLVAFIKLRELARQHAALRKLKDLLAPKIVALYMKKRRIAREKTVLALFGHTMQPITVTSMRNMPLFRDLDDNTLETLVPHWTACCCIDEFVVDERELDSADLYVLDQGLVEVTKRRVPTLDVLAQMMASKSYIANHGSTWMSALGGAATISLTTSDTPNPEGGTGNAGLTSPVLKSPLHMTEAAGNAVLALQRSGASSQPAAAAVDEGEDTSPFLARLAQRRRVSVFNANSGVLVIPKRQPKTLSEALRENYDVIGTIHQRGTTLGLLSMLEGAPTFVGIRAGSRRCMLWRLPRRLVIDVLRRRPRTVYEELIRELRLVQLPMALPPTPQSLRNCDINLVFRHWTDAALTELIAALNPACFMEGELIWDSTPLQSAAGLLHSPAGSHASSSVVKPPIVFIARGVAALTTSTTHSLASLFNPHYSSPQKHRTGQHANTSAPAKQNGALTSSKKAAVMPPKQPAPPRPHRAVLPSPGTQNLPPPPTTATVDMMAVSLHMSAHATSSLDAINAMQGQRTVVLANSESATEKAPEVGDLLTVETKTIVGPWQCVGDTQALITERRASSLSAMSRVDAWVCSREVMTSIIQGHPALLLIAIQSIKDLRAAQVAERGHGMLREFLASDPLLKNAPERLIDELVANATPFWLPPHEYLCGKDPLLLPSLMVILDGTAYAQRTSGSSGGGNSSHGGASGGGANGHASASAQASIDLYSAQLGPGCVLNTAAMLLEQPWVHSFNIRSRTVVEGYEVTSDVFVRCVERTFGSRKADQANALMSKLKDAATASTASTASVPFVFGTVSQEFLANAAAVSLQR
jgi:CRP-like cAMP-binding protein